MSDTVLRAGDSNLNVSPSRNTRAESGFGRLFSQTKNTLPRNKAVSIKMVGKTAPQWNQSASVERNAGVLPGSKATVVSVKSANASPAQVGFNGTSWGIAGESTGTVAAAAPKTNYVPHLVWLGLALTALVVVPRLFPEDFKKK